MLVDLRQKLIDHGFPEEEVKTWKKKELMEQIAKLEKEENLLENLGMPENEEVVVTEDNGPSYSSKEWNEYVISQFGENELTDGHPNVNGLRRLVEVLLGPIISSRPVWVEQKGGSPGHASCIYEIGISWKRNDDGFLDYGDYGMRLFGGVAGAYEGNTDGEFAVYPEAIAETRAEVRALRKALRLHQVAAEEVSKKAKITVELQGKVVEWDENALLDPIQVKTITKRCESLGINLVKFVETRGVDSVEKLTKAAAADLIMLLNKYQTKNEEIPPNLCQELQG